MTGEIADMLIDRMLDDYDGGYDEQDITCKLCGADELAWEEARGEHNRKRWVLVERNGSVHACPNAPSAADANEFPIESPDNDNGTGVCNIPQANPGEKNVHSASRRSRAIQPKRVAAVDSVPRKHDVSAKPRKRR